MLITVVIAMRERAIGPILGAIGIATGVAYWLVVVGNLLGLDWLISIAAALGGVVLAPVFYIWIGLSRKNLGIRDLATTSNL